MTLTPPIITRVHVTQLTKGLFSLNIVTMPNNASWTLTRSYDDLVSFTRRLSRMAKGEGILTLVPIKPQAWWWAGKPSVGKIQGYFDALFGKGDYPRWLISSELVCEFFMSESGQLPSLQTPMPNLVRVRIGEDTIKVNCASLEGLKAAIKEKMDISVTKLFYVDAEGDVIVIAEEDEMEAALMQTGLLIQAE